MVTQLFWSKMTKETYRQRSCQDEEGNLLYPGEWYCNVCGTIHDSENVAKFCCYEEKQLNEDIEIIYEDEYD